jgi:hypothetical protein
VLVAAGAILSFSMNFFGSANQLVFESWTDSEALVASKVIADKRGVPTPHNLGFIAVIGSDPSSSIMDSFSLENSEAVEDILIDQPVFESCGDTCFMLEVPVTNVPLQYYLGRELIVGANSAIVHQVDVLNRKVFFKYEGFNFAVASFAEAKLSGAQVDTSDIEYRPYSSSFGLQGVVMSFISNSFPDLTLSGLRDIMAALSALSLTLLFYLTYTRIGAIWAYAIAVSLLFSPWIVAMSVNIFWFLPLFLLPMVVSILLAGANSRGRQVFYSGLLAILLTSKFLMGYEFTSTLLLTCLGFGLLAVGKKWNHPQDQPKSANMSKFEFSVIISFLGVTSFVSSLLIHASRRGVDVADGLRRIFFEDVLRRTHATPGSFSDVYNPSLEADTLSVVSSYVFNWSTPVLQVGPIPLGPFWLLSLAALASLLWVSRVNTKLIKSQALGGLAIISGPFSWFILAKAHSFIHVHINFFIMYLGLIPLLVYLLALSLVGITSGTKPREKSAVNETKMSGRSSVY